jgi:hypothetical protein
MDHAALAISENNSRLRVEGLGLYSIPNPAGIGLVHPAFRNILSLPIAVAGRNQPQKNEALIACK